MADYTIRRLDEVPDAFGGQYPGDDAVPDRAARGRAGRGHPPAHAARVRWQGRLRAPPQDPGGDLLRGLGPAAVQARRRGHRRGRRERGAGRARTSCARSGTRVPTTPSCSSSRCASRTWTRTRRSSRTSGPSRAGRKPQRDSGRAEQRVHHIVAGVAEDHVRHVVPVDERERRQYRVDHSERERAHRGPPVGETTRR